MLFLLALFVLMLIWGLKEGDIYAKEAAFWSAVFIPLFALSLVPRFLVWSVAPLVIIDVILVLKVVGSDVAMRR